MTTPKRTFTSKMPFPLCLLVVTTLFAFAAITAHALTVSSPSSDSYWVSNHTNILNWKANSTDADHFSVQLLNANQSSLNGNFQIANALNTVNGTAVIQLDAIPEGQYTLLLVNSSNYELDHPQVYYTTSAFEIKANGTEPAKVQANTNAAADDDTATQTSAGASPAATLSASGNEETQSGTADKATTNSAHSLAVVVKQSGLALGMAVLGPLALAL